jgi:hypothetical protein
MIVFEELGDAGNYETVTPTSSTGVTTSFYNDSSRQAKTILVTVETNTVTFTMDGTTPTNAAGTNAGHYLLAGESIIIKGINNIRAFRCVDTVAAAAGVVKITVFY